MNGEENGAGDERFILQIIIYKLITITIIF